MPAPTDRGADSLETARASAAAITDAAKMPRDPTGQTHGTSSCQVDDSCRRRTEQGLRLLDIRCVSPDEAYN
jgi:hypothetical protein